MCQSLKLLALTVTAFLVDAWQLGSKRQQVLVGNIAMRQQFQEPSQGDRWTLRTSASAWYGLM